MFVKTVYTITELSAATGLSRGRVRRLLQHKKIEVVALGHRKVGVLISTLRNHFPELWDSIEEKMHLERLGRLGRLDE